MESTLCAVCCVWQSIEKKMENINTHTQNIDVGGNEIGNFIIKCMFGKEQ